MFWKRLLGFFSDVIEVVVFAFAIFLFVYLLIMQPHKIKGTSMEPNYPDAEYLLTDKVTYRFREPKRGDVIVFLAPGTNGEEFIKRIIGLPGETVSVSGGKVFINNEVLNESYLATNVVTEGGQFLPDSKEVTIPNGVYFVLGDNRVASSDSRSWGFVPKENIRGKAWFIYWPVNNLGVVKDVSYN